MIRIFFLNTHVRQSFTECVNLLLPSILFFFFLLFFPAPVARLPCSEPGCVRGAKGSSGKCVAHGGGKCSEPDCTKHAIGPVGKCFAHGEERMSDRRGGEFREG